MDADNANFLLYCAVASTFLIVFIFVIGSAIYTILKHGF
jgi:hypothetical protein